MAAAVFGMSLNASPAEADREPQEANGAADGEASAADGSASSEEEEGSFGSNEIQQYLPAGLSDEQIATFFTRVSEIEWIEADVGPMIEEWIEPGPKVEGWENTGIDIRAELASLDGGIDGNLLYDTQTTAPNVIDLSGRSVPSLAGYVSYEIRPDPAEGAHERAYYSITPGIWFEGSWRREQVGNATCSDGGASGLTIHASKPYTEWTEDDLLSTAWLFAVTERLVAVPMCEVYEKREDGTYLSTLYYRNGATVPVMDEESTPMAILPVAELDRFLREN